MLQSTQLFDGRVHIVCGPDPQVLSSSHALKSIHLILPSCNLLRSFARAVARGIWTLTR